MSNIKFKIAAKTDVGRVRTNNEDNLQAASDLTTAPMKWVNDQECDLGDKGALLVVADGMGGMNAGEVASEIAISTIRDFFSPDCITDEVMSSKVSIDTFMKKAIKEADKKIKESARANSANKGMGTTIVIGWILGDKLYVAWCGDSRAYIYNRKNGLRQLSKDHSYVQTLVDNGTITKEDAFDYPDSNIITRCLSDSDQKARPDSLSTPVTLCNDDIVLLCTDGLSGMIRDHEIEMVLTENYRNISICADKLIEAACEASGQDNITVALCQILSGGSEATRGLTKNGLSNTISFSNNGISTINFKKWFKYISKLLIILSIFAVGYFCGLRHVLHKIIGLETNELRNDTIQHEAANSTPAVSEESQDQDVVEKSSTPCPVPSGDAKNNHKDILEVVAESIQSTSDSLNSSSEKKAESDPSKTVATQAQNTPSSENRK